MEFLKDYKKWRMTATTSSSDLKCSATQEDSDYTTEAKETPQKTPQKRPIGNKKQKAMQSLEIKADQWMKAIVKKKRKM